MNEVNDDADKMTKNLVIFYSFAEKFQMNEFARNIAQIVVSRT